MSKIEEFAELIVVDGDVEFSRDEAAALLDEIGTLQERLAAAEDVCVLVAWCPSRSNGTDREKAAHELWRRWLELVGDERVSAGANPHLSDEVIEQLARKRDAARRRVLTKLHALGVLPDDGSRTDG